MMESSAYEMGNGDVPEPAPDPSYGRLVVLALGSGAATSAVLAAFGNPAWMVATGGVGAAAMNTWLWWGRLRTRDARRPR